MAAATGTQRGGAAFDVEGFGWASDGRLEVNGRWWGVRGRRFMRPTLEVRGEGGRRRLLAVLEHKPWAVLDGERWTCAFAWDGDPAQVDGAVLAVAPGLAVELPPPAAAGPRAGDAEGRGRGADVERLRGARPAATVDAPDTAPGVEGPRGARPDAPDVAPGAWTPRPAELPADATAELDRLRAEREELRRRVDAELQARRRAQERLAAAEAALREQEELRSRFERERDAALRVREQLAAAEEALREREARGRELAAERDAAVRAGEELRARLEDERAALGRAGEELRARLEREHEQLRERVVRERDAAVSAAQAAHEDAELRARRLEQALGAARRERDALDVRLGEATEARAGDLRERTAALTRVAAERDEALAQRDAARRERTAMLALVDDLRAERDRLVWLRRVEALRRIQPDRPRA
jgi:hypothetical protein